MMLERGIMSTDELEQLAMLKTYNENVPDELKEESKEETVSDPFLSVPSLLARHSKRETVTLEENDFSYLKIKDTDFSWHFLKLFSGQYGMLLASDYIFDYSSCLNNTKMEGKFSFRKGKEFLLEYRQISQEEYTHEMQELSTVYKEVEHFELENGMVLCEYEEDAIYAYQENYLFRLSGYSRNQVQEYFEMYLFLRSFTRLQNGKYEEDSLLKYIYLGDKYGLESLYQGTDLRKETVSSTIQKYQDSLDVEMVSLNHQRYFEIFDIDYYISKRKKSYKKEEYSPLEIHHQEDWTYTGTFSLGILGTYEKGALEQFSSIFQSVELKEREKKELLLKIMEEKEQECLEKKEEIIEQVLLKYFQDCTNHPLESFRKDHWIDFLKVEKIALQELSVAVVENWIEEHFTRMAKVEEDSLMDSEEWKEFFSYIDLSALATKILPDYLTITPLFLLVECQLMGEKKTYIITEDEGVLEWAS